MANIKIIKKKIKTTQSTHKITSAMKLVSAAKFNRAQMTILNSRPYARELELTLKTISALVENYQHPYFDEKPENNRAILLVFSANKGLCSSFNSNLAKTVNSFIKESSLDIQVHFIGRKVFDVLKNQVNVGELYQFAKSDPALEELRAIAEKFGALFATGEIGQVYVAYNTFISAMSFSPTIKKVLPISLDLKEKEEVLREHPVDFKYNPSADEILNALIPETYITSLYTCLLESIAAEHGARMTAMDSASKNCEEAIHALTLKMNKMRQAAITTELIEVVSGAESLNA